MEIAPSARKHGVAEADMRHAVRNAIDVRWQSPRRLLHIGADLTGQLHEVVVLDPDDDPVIIHAMRLRPKFYDLLQG